MSIDYKYDPLLNLVRTTVIGVFTTEDIIEHAKKISEDVTIKDSFSEIVDMNSAVDLVAKFSDRLNMNDAFSQWRAHGHIISIFYTPNELSTDITEFMLPLVRSSGLSVHTSKTEQQSSELLKIINLENGGNSNT